MQPPPESADGRRAPSTCSTTAPRRTTTVGCMAGLLRLFSPYHRSHHRKRLTAKSGNAKQQQQQPPPPCSPPSLTPKKKKSADASSSPLHAAFLSPVKPKKPSQQQPQQAGAVRRRRSCDAPRSPTIAPEHRRRASCDSPRPSPPAIVARLMGLEESAPPSPAATAAARPVLPTRPPPPPPRPQPAPETAAEKRRKLLGALEKCDEDLKTLRRIIAAVRAAEMRAAAASDAVVAPPVATPPGNNNKWVVGGCDEQSSPSPQQHTPGAGEQYPSPDSVLDNAIVSSPRFPCRKRPSPCSSTDHDAKPGNGAVVPVPSAAGTATNKVVKPSRTFVFSGDYCKIKAGGDELHTAVGGVHHRPAVVGNTEASCTLFRPRLPRAAGAESWRHHRRRWEMEAAAAGRVISRATLESVAEVWGQQQQQGAQRWECGMVAAALEHAILQDLVTDMVTELLPQSGITINSAAGCRKRLCF